eukprot:301035-Pyramimonas_sp.AAC.1
MEGTSEAYYPKVDSTPVHKAQECLTCGHTFLLKNGNMDPELPKRRAEGRKRRTAAFIGLGKTTACLMGFHLALTRTAEKKLGS